MAQVITERPVILAPGVVTRSDRPGLVPQSDKLEGYVPSSEPDGAIAPAPTVDLDVLRKMLREYVDLKSEEIRERLEARRYYHAKRWSDEELHRLESEGRPDITKNRIAKKINGVIGLLERIRQDPKAYPTKPNHEAGAEIASHCLRFVLDSSEWESKLSDVVLDLCVDGLGGWQLDLDAAEDGSQDPRPVRVRPETFFYDPRSVEADFSDARFVGVAKWMAKDEALAFLPDSSTAIEDSVSWLASGGDADALDPDKEPLWWDGSLKKLRIIEVWYREGDRWLYAIHTGHAVLMSGESPFVDAKSKPTSRFFMQSANVDEEGIRYGFVRNLKGAQDEINHRSSKSVHAFNSKQIVVEGPVDPAQVDLIRDEAHKVDGVLYMPNGATGKITVLQNTDIGMANVQLLQEAKEEIENFGPNPALVGQGLDNKSGRAIALLQQAAIAELGPFIVRMRAMKLRVYIGVWQAIRQFWTTPRFVRVTDADETAFLGINQPVMNQFGMKTVENPIGRVQVDFKLDEGPDTITLRQDALQAVSQAMSAAGAALPPPVVVAFAKTLVRLTDMPPTEKKEILEAFDALEAPPPPAQQMGAEIQLRQGAAKAAETEASAALKAEQAREAAFTNAANQLAAQIAMAGRASMV